ncbi:MAG: TRAP transporter TAXI family solute receptor [Oleiphilaceae bacterium]|jgi:TRAP transporter TAXI family solute receptor
MLGLKKTLIGIAALCLFLSFSALVGAKDKHYMIVGTGGVTGVYYPTGGAICRMINRLRLEHGIRCGVESTLGSVYNLEKVRERDLDMAVVQSDWQFHAYNGSSEFQTDGPDKDLRSVFSLYSEPFTIVARKDSGIKAFADLKGKRINLGNLGSGHRATMEVLMKEMGWTRSMFSHVSEVKSSDQAKALCNNEFDAMVFMVGHPSASIKEATTACDSILLDVTGKAVEKMVNNNAYYREATIPAGMYRGTDREVKTFGVGATFVASRLTPDEVVYQLTKVVFENLLEFKQLHPAFNDLQKKQMVNKSLSAPLHSGAMRYYREVGLR